jgi:hypothetical protein
VAANSRGARGVGMVPRAGGWLPSSAPLLPSWLSEADLDVYVGEFARSGFRGPLDYYRNIDRNSELTGAFDGTKVTVPGPLHRGLNISS